MSEARIFLRAMAVRLPDGGGSTGVCLPDGRFILAGGRGGIETYSNEQTLMRQYPTGRIVWLPNADATVNHVAASGMVSLESLTQEHRETP